MEKQRPLYSFSIQLFDLKGIDLCIDLFLSCIDLFLTNRKYSFKCSDSYETGVSDHHHMIYTMLKSCFNNTEPKLLNYRDFKHFSLEDFKEEPSAALCDCGNSYDDFDHIFTSKLNKHAPKKKKWIRGNNKPHVNKPFWVRCKPYFTNKHSKADTDIMLSENGELILKNKEIANTFNDHFGSIVDNLGLDHWDDHSLSPTKGDDRIDNIIKRYKNRPKHQEHQS